LCGSPFLHHQIYLGAAAAAAAPSAVSRGFMAGKSSTSYKIPKKKNPVLASNLSILRLSMLQKQKQKQTYLDVVGVGKEHGEAIQPNTPPAGRGQSVLKGHAEGLVNHLRLVVSGRLVASLLLEPTALVKRIVQLGVCVANLLLRNEQFETLGKTLHRPVPFVILGGRLDVIVPLVKVGSDNNGSDNEVKNVLLGQRGHHHGVVQNEHGRNRLAL
jgi:hypothetical protein